MIRDNLFVNANRVKPIDRNDRFWYKVIVHGEKGETEVRIFEAPVLKMVKFHVSRMIWPFKVIKEQIEILNQKPDKIDVVIK
jgi:hypothetical protein